MAGRHRLHLRSQVAQESGTGMTPGRHVESYIAEWLNYLCAPSYEVLIANMCDQLEGSLMRNPTMLAVRRFKRPT